MLTCNYLFHRISTFGADADLMGKQQAAGVELCCTQCYGIAAYFAEYAAAVGHPLGPPSFAEAPTQLSQRTYSHSLVLVNAFNFGHEGGQQVAIKLPLRAGGYKDLYGKAYHNEIALEPQSGAVLLFSASIDDQ